MTQGVAVSASEEQAHEPLWAMWRALVSEFRFSRLVGVLVTSGSGYGFYGVDVVSSLNRSPMARRARAVVADVPDEVLDQLIAVAAVNARRNEAMWRMGALFYVTVPVTLFLAGLEGAPDYMREFIRDTAALLVIQVVALTIWLLYYFANQWRARQIEAVLELIRIERGRPA